MAEALPPWLAANPVDPATAMQLAGRASVARRELDQRRDQSNMDTIFKGINAAAEFEKIAADKMHQERMSRIAEKQEQNQRTHNELVAAKDAIAAKEKANQWEAKAGFDAEIQKAIAEGIPFEKAVPNAVLKYGHKMGIGAMNYGSLMKQYAPKPNVAATKAFDARISALGKLDPEAAGTFQQYVGTEPNPTVQQALSVAEQAAQQRNKNTADIAEIEAQQRGDVPTTTIRDNKPSVTYRPKSESAGGGGEPHTKTLPNGAIMVWRDKGNSVHIINGDRSQNLTPNQLAQLAKGLDESDPRRKELLDIATSAAMESAKPKGGSSKATKLQRGQELAKQHPDWTKEQVIKAVEDEFGGK